MKIYISSDHAGFKLKGEIVKFLSEKSYDVEDSGPYDYNETDDYPDYVAAVARQVSANPNDNFGIVIGGSGQGEAIMANRFPNVRAVVFNGQYAPPDGHAVPDEIAFTREHNDANILSIGAWFIDEGEVKRSVLRWLATPFTGEERHIRRLRKIEALTPHGRIGDAPTG